MREEQKKKLVNYTVRIFPAPPKTALKMFAKSELRDFSLLSARLHFYVLQNLRCITLSILLTLAANRLKVSQRGAISPFLPLFWLEMKRNKGLVKSCCVYCAEVFITFRFSLWSWTMIRYTKKPILSALC